MSKLEEAIIIAVEAHKGQRDKFGAPYILHPLRVMARVKTEEEMMVAILHDVVEDTEWTFDRLRKVGFSETVVEAIDCVTKRAGESYDSLIDRARRNPLARRVKIADLEDNMDIRRIPEVTARDAERLAKYRRAWQTLTDQRQ
jgi:(p)ppGpp synthase/HD superfamily hydrolase